MSEKHQEAGQPPELPGIYTETLARLYATQGLYEQALTIYRQLLQRQPENQELLRTIATVEQCMAGATAPETGGGEPPSASREQSRRARRRVHQVVAHLERWLAQLRRQRQC
jgi:hypothetical protein